MKCAYVAICLTNTQATESGVLPRIVGASVSRQRNDWPVHEARGSGSTGVVPCTISPTQWASLSLVEANSSGSDAAFSRRMVVGMTGRRQQAIDAVDIVFEMNTMTGVGFSAEDVVDEVERAGYVLPDRSLRWAIGVAAFALIRSVWIRFLSILTVRELEAAMLGLVVVWVAAFVALVRAGLKRRGR